MKGIKTGGRQKGTPNKLTKELREVLKNVVYKQLESLDETLNELEPKERLEITIKLMAYALPKVQTISPTTNEPLDFN